MKITLSDILIQPGLTNALKVVIEELNAKPYACMVELATIESLVGMKLTRQDEEGYVIRYTLLLLFANNKTATKAIRLSRQGEEELTPERFINMLGNWFYRKENEAIHPQD